MNECKYWKPSNTKLLCRWKIIGDQLVDMEPNQRPEFEGWEDLDPELHADVLCIQEEKL